MLLQTGRLGAGIGDALPAFLDDLQHKRPARAAEKAAKAPTRMLLPIVVCAFPSTIMVVIGPAAIPIHRTIRPMLMHGK